MSCGNCFGCDNCYSVCPDNAITKLSDGQYAIDYDYCKGCGLRAAECPSGAIEMYPSSPSPQPEPQPQPEPPARAPSPLAKPSAPPARSPNHLRPPARRTIRAITDGRPSPGATR
jgi:2-oxoacid:acceptor oxidoreductase delta subunit (pyruvate/2-ketoisovalerate family)